MHVPRYLAHARQVLWSRSYKRDLLCLRPSSTSPLTHLDTAGHARMVDVGHKAESRRTAIAGATVELGKDVYTALRASLQMETDTSNEKRTKVEAKGDVLGVARVAGIMAAKRTSELIPLCHPVGLDVAAVEMTLNEQKHAVDVRTKVSVLGKTGVEMEALCAASIAALTLYDMCKAASKGIVITNVRLIEKTGGKSGAYRRNEQGGS